MGAFAQQAISEFFLVYWWIHYPVGKWNIYLLTDFLHSKPFLPEFSLHSKVNIVSAILKILSSVLNVGKVHLCHTHRRGAWRLNQRKFRTEEAIAKIITRLNMSFLNNSLIELKRNSSNKCPFLDMYTFLERHFKNCPTEKLIFLSSVYREFIIVWSQCKEPHPCLLSRKIGCW